jgi:checkpoint serine/threonine-protein kinase
MLKNAPRLKAGVDYECNGERYKVLRLIAKGSYGSVFYVKNLKSDKFYAAKQEKPPNLWEYYITLELTDRLKTKHLSHILPAFMTIHQGIIANNSSVLITEFAPHGTIIDVCNRIKQKTGKNVDEYIGMIFASQILSIMDFLHSCNIIHADIKPDNFLLMSE